MVSIGVSAQNDKNTVWHLNNRKQYRVTFASSLSII